MTIGFIGAGNMASALAHAIARAHPDSSFTAHDISTDALDRFADGLAHFAKAANNQDVCRQSDLVFLAVKPQIMPAVLSEIRDSDALFVSIAAGVTLATLEDALPAGRIVRVMPNTPGLVGEMAAGYAGGARATENDVALVGDLLSSAGVAIRMDESLIDVVTGVSGSGPAFVARLIESFVDAAVANGMNHDDARRLVLATFSGTARLLAERSLSPDELVTMVSSPGGTTVAGRGVLEQSDYRDVIARTVEAAIARSKELGA